MASRNSYEHVADMGTVDGCNNESINLVRHVASGRKYICKYVRVGYGERELELLSQLTDHPHIVQIRSFYPGVESITDEQTLAGEVPFDRIYMEYCNRGSLKDVMDVHEKRKVPIPEAFIWEVLESVLSALLFAHLGQTSLPPGDPSRHSSFTMAAGWDPVIHQDITPANVFLTNESAPGRRHFSLYPRVVLGDFGAGRFYSEMSHLFGVREIFESDLYNLGEVGMQLMSVAASGGEPLGRYSDALKTAINACAAFDNAEELLRLVLELKDEQSWVPEFDEPLLRA